MLITVPPSEPESPPAVVPVAKGARVGRSVDFRRKHRHKTHAHAHLTARTDADVRFSRILTFSSAAIILTSLVVGWRYLVPEEAQMLERLVVDGRLKEASVLARRLSESEPSANGNDYRDLSVEMLVEDAMGAELPVRASAFARRLALAAEDPADAYLASAALRAMRKLGVGDGATEWFAEHCGKIPPHLVTLWVEGLVDYHLSNGRPEEALRVALIGWDLAPGRAITPEYLLKIARLAGKPGEITGRLRGFVVTQGHFDAASVYRSVARETGGEAEALHELWPFLMMFPGRTDYADLAKSILACGPVALRRRPRF